MRRWFEFGSETGSITGKWSLNSNTKKSGPRPHDVGEFLPAFVSMPHKEQLFSALVAISSSKDLSAIWLRQIDQGVDPLGGCPAEHIPRAFSANGIAAFQFFANPMVMPWGGYPIFDENSTFTGSFSDPLLTGPTFEPPSENG
jgi:hypothetical protein